LAREVIMQALLKTLWRDVSGQDTTEYVLLVLLVALAVTAGMIVLATSINGAFSDAAATLDGGGSGPVLPPPPVP
jgi:Flp pilus assembly pilin Flp